MNFNKKISKKSFFVTGTDTGVGKTLFCSRMSMNDMPGMDGIEATKKIRKSMKNPNVPIIGMSAHAFAHERQDCLGAGMNDFVTKPVDYDVLFEKIDAHTRGQSGQLAANMAETS